MFLMIVKNSSRWIYVIIGLHHKLKLLNISGGSTYFWGMERAEFQVI